MDFDNSNVGLLSGLAGGLQSGLNAYLKSRDSEEDRLERQAQKKLREKEYKLKLTNEGFEEDPDTGELRETDERKKQKAFETASKKTGFLKEGFLPTYNEETGNVDITQFNKPQTPTDIARVAYYNALANKANRSDSSGNNAVARQVEADRQKRIEHAKIPGYEVDANIGIPAETEKKAFQESLISTGNLKDSLENIKNEINTNGIQGALVNEYNPFTSQKALESKSKIEKEAGRIILEAKNAEKLGVLSKSDMDLVERTFGNFSGLLAGRLGAEKVIEQIEEAQKRIDDSINKKSSVLGYKKIQNDMGTMPLASSEQGMLSPQKKGVLNSAQTLPPPQVGQEDSGFIYIGGDPANPKSWKRK